MLQLQEGSRMAGRLTRAQELGLTEEIEQEEDGSYSISLSDPQGSILFANEGYSSEYNAHKAGGYWIREHYRPADKPTPKRPSPTGQSGQILSMLRTKAEENASQALRLRQQADLLETEAKKLQAAADVLEGPELDG